MSDDSAPPASLKLTTTQWLICVIASIGFAFDIYELLMLPLIIKPAMAALSAPIVDQMVAAGSTRPDAIAEFLPGGPQYVAWARTLFFVPAIAGGLFGLLGGWLTDRLGRRRVLTFSILLYACGALAAGFAKSLEMLLICRCVVFVGVCVEFVAAVAWLAELFPDRDQREKILGWTQAFSSFGGMLVAGMNYLAGTYAADLPAIHAGHEAWRYTLISGFIPALPLLVIRPFLPESPEWQRKKDSGLLRRPSIGELFSPELRRTTIMTTIVFAASYGLAFGAIQQLPQIVGTKAIGTPKESGHPEILAAAKEAAGSPTETNPATGKPQYSGKQKGAAANESDRQVASITSWQEFGGLAGRALLAVLAVVVIGRRTLLRIFQIPALVIIPGIFYWIHLSMQDGGTAIPLIQIKWAIFLAGVFVVAQFSFWGNYIPMVFPVHLRGTGESFAANIGGRILGTAAAFLAQTLSTSMPLAKAGAIVAGAYAIVGVIATHWLPEPPPEDLS